MFLFIIFSTLLMILDVLTKVLAVHYLAWGRVIVLIPGFLSLEYVENPGAAFGLFSGMSFLLILVAAAVLSYILYHMWLERCKSRLQYAGLIFLFAGTLGNLYNRIRLGYVVDFLRIPNWPNFNFADIFINIGVLLLILYIFRMNKIQNS